MNISKVVGVVLLILLSEVGLGQYKFNKKEIFEFQKREFNWGLHYNAGAEREETRTDTWRQYEELNTGAVKFQTNSRFWNFLDFKQEKVELNIEAGPLWGNGNWIDSSMVANTEANHKIFGLRTYASASYSSRFYYNQKSYTIVQVNGWGRYDLYNQNSTGFSSDSNQVVTDFEKKSTEDKFRFNVSARAGWGIGRMNPMNNFMIADYILEKYYGNTNFSQDEISKFAKEIRRIKGERNIKTGHKTDKETEQIQEYLNQKMFQMEVSGIEEDWKNGEFAPRLNGNRVEFGPFFNYFNQEPDFIYGAYFLYNHAKYCNVKWNRNFSAGINYNAYKKKDWILAELNMGWSYFLSLKSQFDFGVKYVPGMAINGTENNSLNNGFIPYLGYFTQINSKNRIDVKLSYRFSEDENLMLPGPDVSVSIYRSRF